MDNILSNAANIAGQVRNAKKHGYVLTQINCTAYELRFCNQFGLLSVTSGTCQWLLVPLGCPVTESLCRTATAAVGAWSAVAVCLLGERDMKRSPGRAVGCGCSCHDAVSGDSRGMKGVLFSTATPLGC